MWRICWVRDGAAVSAYEPFKPDFAVAGVQMVHSLEEAVKQADLVVLLVGHSQFKSLDPKRMATLTAARLVVDTVNGWNNQSWQEAGFKVIKLGKGQK